MHTSWPTVYECPPQLLMAGDAVDKDRLCWPKVRDASTIPAWLHDVSLGLCQVLPSIRQRSEVCSSACARASQYLPRQTQTQETAAMLDFSDIIAMHSSSASKMGSRTVTAAMDNQHRFKIRVGSGVSPAVCAMTNPAVWDKDPVSLKGQPFWLEGVLFKFT